MIKFTKQDVADFLQQKDMHVEKFGEKNFDRLFNKDVYEAKVTHIKTGVGEDCLLDANEIQFALGSEERDDLVFYSSCDWSKFLIARHPENIPYYHTIFDKEIEAKTKEYESKRSVLKRQLDMLDNLHNADIFYLNGLKKFANKIATKNAIK